MHHSPAQLRILYFSYKFLRSFSGAGDPFPGWSDIESSEEIALRDAKLHGFPSPLLQKTKDEVKLDVAKAWEDELEKLAIKLPRTMKRIKKVADVDTMLRSILVWRGCSLSRLFWSAGMRRRVNWSSFLIIWASKCLQIWSNSAIMYHGHLSAIAKKLGFKNNSNRERLTVWLKKV